MHRVNENKSQTLKLLKPHFKKASLARHPDPLVRIRSSFHFSTASAAIAALSVHKLKGGINNSAISFWPISASFDRKALFAETPATNCKPCQSGFPQCLSALGREYIHYGRLKARCKIGPLLSRGRRRCLCHILAVTRI